MVFRRKKRQPPPPPAPPAPAPPEWAPRVDAARELIATTPGGAIATPQLHAMEQALHDAEADRTRVRDAARRLGPEQTLADLKAAMRANPHGAPSPEVEALQRRHALINDLLNRDEQLGAQITRAVADLDALAAEAVHAAALAPSDADSLLRSHLDRIQEDIQALAAAHNEIGRLAGPGSTP